MAKYKRKQNKVEALNWDEFIEYGKEQTVDLISKMPWHFTNMGNTVTHENDELYCISCSVAGGEYNMDPKKMLVMYDDGSVNTLSEFQFNQLYELDVQSEELETELATEPYLEFMREFTNHDTFEDCNFHKFKYDEETGELTHAKVKIPKAINDVDMMHIFTITNKHKLAFEIKRSGSGLSLIFNYIELE